MKKFLITESEKSRILGMHRGAVISEKKPINEVTLKDIQGVLIQKGFLAAGQDDDKIGPTTLGALKNALSPAAPQGTAGTSGVAGTQGTAGTSGVAGTQGVSGTSDLAGTSGNQQQTA
jgi:hypothetical protein